MKGGNFFESVPAEGDAYIMKHIIQDWNEEQCITLLKNCRSAMKEGGKLLIIEMIIPVGNKPSPAKFLDLQMLQYLPRCERTENESNELLNQTEFELARVVPTMSPFSIIEGVSK